MEINEFLEVLCSYMGKSRDFFDDGQTDKALMATNNAKRFIERRRDFELSKTTVSVEVPGDNNGVLMDECTDIYTGELVKVKKPYAAWKQNSQGALYPVSLVSDKGLFDRINRQADLGQIMLDAKQATMVAKPMLYLTGGRLFSYPPSTETIPYQLNVYAWLKRYGLDEADPQYVQTDFLMEYCSDYLLYRAMTELNVFVKEDQRVGISQTKMTEAWDAVVAWDSTSIKGDEEID